MEATLASKKVHITSRAVKKLKKPCASWSKARFGKKFVTWLMAEIMFTGVKKTEDVWLDRARVSSFINKTNISILIRLIYHDVRKDICY